MNEQNRKIEGGTRSCASEKLEENRQKLLACNRRMMEMLERILEISEKTLIGVVHPSGYKPGQYGQDYRDLGKAVSEIRTICKHDLSGDFPDYEWMAGMMTSEHFDPNRLAEEIEAKASEKPVDYPTFYTPGWLCELAKKLGATGVSPVAERKHSMDFDKFHVTRAAVKGRTVLTFNRKADPDNQGQSRQIVATIIRYNGGVSISVMDYQEGRCATPKRIMSSDMHGVGLSRSEKIAYTAVRKLVKETKRRRIVRKRQAAAKRAAETAELIKKEMA